jgi:hypothetical protein
MELLEGETVLEMIEREGRVDPTDAMRVVKQAAMGLGAAHAKHIVHRDVKPQNLVILADGIVKVVDFGLATEAHPDAAGARIGTPHYMAPEVCEARPAEARSDVYGLGITLYHLLVGQPPYAGKSLKEIVAAHVAGHPLHPERQVPSLPTALSDLVRDMTKRDPLTRIELAEVVERIDRIGGEEIKSDKGLRLRRGAARRRALAGRRGTPAWALALGALGVAAIATALLAGGGGDDEPGRPGPAASAPEPAAQAPPALPTPVDPAADRRRAEERARAAEEAQRGVEAERALAEAERYARESWEDKKGVIRRYRGVSDRFKGTPSGDEARKRADEIQRGLRHPHPDRTVVAKEDVEAAAAAWETARPEWEKAVAEKRYATALELVPPGMEGGEGPVAAEIEFHRALARRLGEFLYALRREVPRLPVDRRTLRVGEEERAVQEVGESAITVSGPDGTQRIAWADVPPEGLADLAARALAPQGSGGGLLLASFAYAHRLPDSFYAALLLARGGTIDRAEARALEELESRAEERFGQ